MTFFGPASATPPGNYWIVDLAPDYSWAIVSDPSGNTGFLLSRTRTVSDALYQELLDRASVQGVKGRITVTPTACGGTRKFPPQTACELLTEGRNRANLLVSNVCTG